MIAVTVPPPVIAGLASIYTITVTNTTSSPMSNIALISEMPTGLTVKNISGCARIGGNQSLSVLCTMPNLAPGASETATVSLLASTTSTFAIPFTADGGIPVPGVPGALQSIDEAVTLSVQVQPGPTDIQVTGSANNGSPPVGSSFNYTFQVKNNGPLPASGVTFDDPLPTAISVGNSVTIDDGTCTPNTVADSLHCDIGSLAVGQQSDITVAATPTAAGVIGNTARVAMAGADLHAANNNVTVVVQPK
jgi:uncharacterized repeat protein (TIGR01451 family)